MNIYIGSSSQRHFVMSFSLNQWHHIAFVKKISDNTVTAYVDGVSKGSLSSTDIPVIATTSYIGRDHSSNYLTGWLDEVRISNVARWTAAFTPPTSAYGVAVSETTIQLTTENITVTDANNALNTTCNMSASLSLGDSWTGVLLIADMAESIGITDAYASYNAACKWSDDTIIIDAVGSFNTTCGLGTEGINVSSDMAVTMQKFVTTSDEFSAGDSLLWGWFGNIAESLGVTDDTLLLIVKYITVNDSFMAWEQLRVGWIFVVADAYSTTEILSYGLTVLVDDQLVFVDLQTNNWNGREILSDSMTIWDAVVGFQRYSQTASDEIAFADSITFATTVTILEIMGFTGLASALLTAHTAIEETTSLTDEAGRGFLLALMEILDVIDVSSLRAMFFDAIEDAMGITGEATNINNISVSASETTAFTETVSNLGQFYSTVSDALAMNVTVEINGEVYECYVLNTPKFYPSVYSGFDFNSYCVYQNRAFGANNTGIYELTGDTDAGAAIHTGVILSATDFQTPNQKRFRRAYLGVSGASPVMIFETAEGQREVYAIDSNGKTVASSEMKSRKWKLSIADFDTLNSIKLIPVVLTK
jgi:hypothetical protein